MQLNILGIGAALVLVAQPTLATTAPRAAHLRAWLQQRLGRKGVRSDARSQLQYVAGWVRLGPGPQSDAIVYLTGPEWCGSGGCDTLVLEPLWSGFRVRGRVTVTRTPIFVLDSRSHGWRDIAVSVCGGGITHCYRARLRYNGVRYTSNASLAPALRAHSAEHVVIGVEAAGQPLFAGPNAAQ